MGLLLCLTSLQYFKASIDFVNTYTSGFWLSFFAVLGILMLGSGYFCVLWLDYRWRKFGLSLLGASTFLMVVSGGMALNRYNLWLLAIAFITFTLGYPVLTQGTLPRLYRLRRLIEKVKSEPIL